MNKVLITGGAGYLGSTLVSELLNNGYVVTVLDNLMYKQISLLPFCGNKYFNYVYGDVRDVELLKSLVSKNDIIIPLAAIVGAPACDRNKQAATDINYRQIENIIFSLSKDQKLIMPNTNSQYGSSNDIISEESSFKPLSHYAVTKCDAENAVLDNGNGIALRLATVFGVSPRMRLDLLVNDFVYRAVTDGFLVLFEANFKRNYIHVRDIAHTFRFMIENYHNLNNSAYNVGLSDANLSKAELADKIKEYVPNLVIEKNEFKEDKDKRNYIVSNEKLESKGWLPKYSIDHGIIELMKAYEMIKIYNNKNFTNL